MIEGPGSMFCEISDLVLVRDLSPGEWMHGPRGSVHAFSNPRRETARALIVLTPDLDQRGQARRFSEYRTWHL